MGSLGDKVSEGIDAGFEVAGRAFWATWDVSGRSLRKVIGSRNDRIIKALQPTVDAVNALEAGLKALPDEALRAKTLEFRDRLSKRLAGPAAPAAAGKEPPSERQRVQAALDALLPEAFAVVREASRRVNRMRHFDVQLIGGTVLHQGKIAEMATGEGKTLVATCPAYLNALLGRGVHVVTVNDYLAKRDRDWMGPIFEFLGLSCAALQNDMDPMLRHAAYRADITYGTNSEFGFDYLRDNMAVRLSQQVQADRFFAIVDEVDSILIDEARTPHIIAGPSEQGPRMYYEVDRAVRQLQKGKDFEVKEKEHTVVLTEEGAERVERLLNLSSLYALENLDVPHFIDKSLKAHHLFHLDKEYVVQEGEVVIVDEHTGRLQPGRRWSDGQHQAIEAKEGLRIKEENQTLATVTLQHYFLMYSKLGGMTGTALTEASEFHKIYNLEVVAIPTNRPMRRLSHPDVIYRSEREKFQAIEDEVDALHREGRPVLAGTISIEKSEQLSARFRRRGLRHEVLNAKHHQREAAIVARAGQVGAITIATNMAGRGTDILLGKPSADETELAYRTDWMRDLFNAAPDPAPLVGKPEEAAKACRETADAAIGRKEKQCQESREGEKRERLEKELAQMRKGREALERYLAEGVAGLGGLHIVGSERHDARRIDNQLRGRSGRQGDPGSSRYYLSLDDELMRKFAGDWVRNMLDKLGMKEGEVIESRMVSRGVERAQKRVEEYHFDMRKNLLEYDEVMNEQRNLVYARRQEVLKGDAVGNILREILDDRVAAVVDEFLPSDGAGDPEGLAAAVADRFSVDVPAGDLKGDREAVTARLQDAVRKAYEARTAPLGPDLVRAREQFILLKLIDAKWKDHLSHMDHLRSGIGLRGYGQVDPRIAYKREGFELFDAMIASLKDEVARLALRVEAPPAEAAAQAPADLARLLEGTWRISGYSGPVDPSEERRAPPEPAPQAAAAASAPRPPLPPAPLLGLAKPAPSTPSAGRNDPCPCGSGKKYKKCHGA